MTAQETSDTSLILPAPPRFLSPPVQWGSLPNERGHRTAALDSAGKPGPPVIHPGKPSAGHELWHGPHLPHKLLLDCSPFPPYRYRQGWRPRSSSRPTCPSLPPSQFSIDDTTDAMERRQHPLTYARAPREFQPIRWRAERPRAPWAGLPCRRRSVCAHCFR